MRTYLVSNLSIAYFTIDKNGFTILIKIKKEKRIDMNGLKYIICTQRKDFSVIFNAILKIK